MTAHTLTLKYNCSGKTYTLFGPGNEPFHVPSPIHALPNSWGIVPRACFEIFRALDFRRQNSKLEFHATVAVSYVEIFGDAVHDLLDQSRPCGQNAVSAQRYVLEGSCERQVASLADLLHLLNIGEAQKKKAATAMNDRSSRAHSVFIVKLEQTCVTTNISVSNRLFFADLGGSEQIKKSQPYGSHNTNKNNIKQKQQHSRRDREREAININLGLLALKQCVEALRERRSYVPYADSKLTMILSEGLGGNSKTAVVVCGAQEEWHGQETISTMKFGQVCRGIHNASSAAATSSMLQELLDTLNRKIAACEAEIRRTEQWQVVEVEETDSSGQVIAVRQKTIITGAEELRRQLDELIQKKMELTGDFIDAGLHATESPSVGSFGKHLVGYKDS